MEGLDKHYQKRIWGTGNKWWSAWREETERRRAEEEGIYNDSPKEHKYLILSKERCLERRSGPRWVCRQCKAEYRVKTPFYRLFCSICLGALRCRRLFPKEHNKPGYWIFDDDRRR